MAEEYRPNTKTETYIRLSRDGKYFISETKITRIFPRLYLDKVLSGQISEEGAE